MTKFDENISAVTRSGPAGTSSGAADERGQGSRRPKILFIQTQAENAGAQEISRLLSGGLEARDYEVHHLFLYRRTTSFDTEPNTTFCADGRPSSIPALMRFALNLVRQIRAIGPDVVLTFQHYGNLFGAVAARLAGIKHVIANQVSAQAAMNDTIRAIDKILGRIGIYDVITVNSADTEGEYKGFPAAYTKRMIKVSHGFKDKTSPLSKAEARAKFGLPQDPGILVLGSVARLHFRKRLDIGIRLLAQNETWHLVLGGQGPEEEALRDLARELGVAGRVHFTGELPSGEVGHLLAAMDIFLFPSEAETFGLAAVEAAQTGLPVISNDIPVLREVLQTSVGPCALFANSDDVQSYLEPIRTFESDAALRERLIQSGRKLKDLYSLDAMVDRYDELIHARLDGGDAPKTMNTRHEKVAA